MKTGKGCESEESMKRRAKTSPRYVKALEGVAAAARDLRQRGVDLIGLKAKALWEALDVLDEQENVPGS